MGRSRMSLAVDRGGAQEHGRAAVIPRRDAPTCPLPAGRGLRPCPVCEEVGRRDRLFAYLAQRPACACVMTPSEFAGVEWRFAFLRRERAPLRTGDDE